MQHLQKTGGWGGTQRLTRNPKIADSGPAGKDLSSCWSVGAELAFCDSGKNHRPFGAPKPNRELRDATAFGVLKLTLKPNAYDWEFIPEAGKTFTDSGSGTCH